MSYDSLGSVEYMFIADWPYLFYVNLEVYIFCTTSGDRRPECRFKFELDTFTKSQNKRIDGQLTDLIMVPFSPFCGTDP